MFVVWFFGCVGCRFTRPTSEIFSYYEDALAVSGSLASASTSSMAGSFSPTKDCFIPSVKPPFSLLLSASSSCLANSSFSSTDIW